MHRSINRVRGWRSCVCLAAALIAMGGLLMPATGWSQPISMVPHRAIYELTTDHITADGPFTGGTGLFSIEIVESCDGWTLNQRIRIIFSEKMGNTLDSDSHFASFEARDGETFTFEVRNLRNGIVVEEYSGSAETDGPGGAGSATFKEPEGERIKLPKGTFFPITYNHILIEKIISGARFVSARTFDGGGLDSAYEVNAVIGDREPGGELQSEGDTQIAEGEVWPVRLAYFPIASSDPEPMIEIDVELLPNGVSPSLVFDYGYIALKASLQRIEELDRPTCR